jgi:ubiquinone/menaquinone biosynthesis C-methylase UbiE
MAVPAADLVEMVGIASGARVLDVGTGTGAAARAAAQHRGPAIVVGVDVSVPMLRAGLAAGGPPRYVSATAIDLPFRDGTFQAVLANFVLSHFAGYETALFDILRVLAPAGRLGATAWGEETDEFSTAWTEVAEQFAEHEILQDARHRAMPWHDHFSNPANLKEALHDAGLRDIRVEKREYRFDMSAEDYLTGREIAATGRFLREALGRELWETFRRRTREVFTERFPPRFHDFRSVILAVGHKP